MAFRLRDADAPPPGPAPGHRLHPAEFRADASDAADRVASLFDGDRDTRWLTGRPQRSDEWIGVGFDRPRDVSRLELATASRRFGDYPRELRVQAISEDGGALMIEQTGQSHRWFWSVHELGLWER